MKEAIKEILKDISQNNNTNNNSMVTLFKEQDFKMEEDFINFIEIYNGTEGYLKDNFLQIWNLKQIIEMNPYYENDENSKSLLFFATDGSNLGYAVDKNTGNIVGVDLLDIIISDKNIIANSFLEFLYKLSD